MLVSAYRLACAALGATLLIAALASPAAASDFSEPWKNPDRGLVIDAYEYNSIDWRELVSDKRIVGFINKASDGLPPAYYCSGDETEIRLCKALWKRHAVARELFHTRRTVAKALGLEWGAYHLARPGNPIEQANNFLDFAEPEPDDLIALDIEENDPEKWMSLADAEEFVRHIHRRIGRFPLLYTNGATATHIAANRESYPLLSRLPLWYARYKPEIGIHFPTGNWESYTLWQFSAQANCNQLRCPYRVPGTPNDIDVNVSSMNAADLRAAWPFGGLIGASIDMIASVPVPISRAAALAGDVTIQFAQVEQPRANADRAAILHAAMRQYPRRASLFSPSSSRSQPQGLAEYQAYLKDIELGHRAAHAELRPDRDPIPTGSTKLPISRVAMSGFARGAWPVFLLKQTDLEIAGRLRPH